MEEQFDHFHNATATKEATGLQLKATFDAAANGKTGGEKGEGDGMAVDDFVRAFREHGTLRDKLDDERLRKLFTDTVVDANGRLSFKEFSNLMTMSEVDLLKMKQLNILNQFALKVDGLVNVEPSREDVYFGEALRGEESELDGYDLVVAQNLSMQLYERRVASLQRFVSMCVMFHQMGKRVADFWPAVSFGLLGYRMDRTHSIMRIATTASPVSGADVRERMHHLALRSEFKRAVHLIRAAVKIWSTDTFYKKKYRERRLLSPLDSSRQPLDSSRHLD